MNRWLTRAALGAALLVTPAFVLAGTGALAPDAERIASHLSERMGLDPATADEVAAIAVSSREEGEVLKRAAGEQAQALKSALDSGDTAAMESAMAELEGIQADARALQEATQGDIRGLLTTEQRAKWTLHHLHKRHQRERARVPHFDGE